MAERLSEAHVISKVSATFSELLDVPEAEIALEQNPGHGVDLLVSAVGRTFMVQVKGTSSAGAVAAYAEHVATATKALRKRAIPVVAVPFMTTSGKHACARAGVSWFDLSGNAHIVAPGIRVLVDGRPNRFRRRGRPASAFAPKSARVTRWLLMHPGEAPMQREIARATGVSEGLVSRIVARLEEERYVARDERGRLRLTSPRLLLEAWQDEYRFSTHTILKGHVAARSGDALTRFVGDTLAAIGVEHAATGLAGAWLLTRFVGFRTATFFVGAEPDTSLENKLGFRENERGANLWLVVPNDPGVFHDAAERGGTRCVHPVQVYLDLAEHPERSSDAAERVRSQLLHW